MFNLSRGLSRNLQVQLSHREMTGRERSACKLGSPSCCPASPAHKLCGLELITHLLLPLAFAFLPLSGHQAVPGHSSGTLHTHGWLWAPAWLLGCWFRLQKCCELGEQRSHVLFYFFFQMEREGMVRSSHLPAHVGRDQKNRISS